MEVIQTRLAVSPARTYNGILDAFAKIVRQEGFAAMFRLVCYIHDRSLSMSQQTLVTGCAESKSAWQVSLTPLINLINDAEHCTFMTLAMHKCFEKQLIFFY